MALSQERIEHIQKLFKGELQTIRETLLMMASMADRNFNAALSALLDRNDGQAEMVEQEDSQLDQLERDVDEMVVAYMATKSPIATICRLMLAATKIAGELETAGDQATGIARSVKHLNVLPPLRVMADIPKVGRISVDMMRTAINAFVEIKPEEALQVVKRDKELDQMCRSLRTELVEFMTAQPNVVPATLHLSDVVKRIEHVGDCAKAISQDVYFLYTAQDIRHTPLEGVS